MNRFKERFKQIIDVILILTAILIVYLFIKIVALLDSIVHTVF